MDKKYKLIRADFLIPVNRTMGTDKRISDGFVFIENDKIVDYGQYTKEKGNYFVSNFGSELQVVGLDHQPSSEEDIIRHRGVILPGFVKAHGHDHESPIIGIARDEPLTPWLDKAVNLFTGFMNEKRDFLETEFGKSPNLVTYLKARVDDIYYGITGTMVHHCNHNKYRVAEIVEANVKAGTKMIVAVGSQDRAYDERILDIPSDLAVERLNKYQSEFGSAERTEIIPGPDQFFSNGPELLKKLKKWSNDHGKLIHIHSSEEPNTTKWFIESYGMTPIEYAESIGFLDKNTIVAHQVNNTDHDLELLKSTGTKVVHNPLANTILGSGMPPVIRMMDMGIPVVISTDGSGSADSQNILSAARAASQYQKAVNQNAKVLTSQEVLEMITIRPAEFLRYNAGSIDKGKDADIVLIDLRRPNMTPTRLDNVVENLIWASDGSEAQFVIANGKLVKDNYEFTTLDRDKIMADVQHLSELLIDYRKTAKEIKGTGAHK